MNRQFLLAMGFLIIAVLLGCDAPSATGPATSAPPGPPGAPPPPPPTGTASTPAPAAGPGAAATPSPAPASAPPTADLTNVEPQVRISAVALGTESESGRAAADAKYGGKVIEVEGVVIHSSGNWENGRLVGEYVALGQPNSGATLVACEFSETQLWKKIAKGSSVKIKGNWKPTPADKP